MLASRIKRGVVPHRREQVVRGTPVAAGVVDVVGGECPQSGLLGEIHQLAREQVVAPVQVVLHFQPGALAAAHIA